MNHDKFAEKLYQAAKNASPTLQFSQNNKLTLDDAYQIQRTSIYKRLQQGEKITGFKLGFTSRTKMEEVGFHDLIWGILTHNMELKAGEEINLNRWINPKAEPEIAFKISKDIEESISLKEIHNYIDAIAPAIEIVDSRYKDFNFSVEDIVADNCSAAGYLIGDWVDTETEVSNLDIHLKVNNHVEQSGKTSAILNNPLQSLVELSRLVSKAGLRVEKGKIVLAGAATAAIDLKPNQHIETQVEKLGKVSFKTK